MAGLGTRNKIDYRLLGMISNLVICSRCLRDGRITPVPQVLSARHTPRSLCGDCSRPERDGLRGQLSRLTGL